jgi:hypothetical protein
MPRDDRGEYTLVDRTSRVRMVRAKPSMEGDW